jgi:hypothetical protein
MTPKRLAGLLGPETVVASVLERGKMKPAAEKSEAIEPAVRAILDDVAIHDDGLAFVHNYANWVMALRKLPPKENSRVFIQLAVLAKQYFDAGCNPVAGSLAALARIGLPHLMKETIFIQIAAYRDPQLIPTIDDCISMASDPQRLRFGICNQTDNPADLNKYSRDPRFRIVYVPHGNSKGVCWARWLIQKLYYQNETYTLQLDSHHRFVKGWDEKLISMIKQLQSKGHKKPLITTYAPNFDPLNDPKERTQEATIMKFDAFTPEGAVSFRPLEVTNPTELTQPIPARFYSAHFAFTLGQMCVEVPHDPNYYFDGEEINIGVRAYTHGYDLFHPNEIILWHEYTRNYRTHAHWKDHPSVAPKLNRAAHKRNRILFGMEPNVDHIDFGEYGFGTERTLSEFEQYAGVRFKDRSVQQYTLQDKRAPNPIDDDWVLQVKHFIALPKKIFVENDYELWRVEFHDAFGNSLYREDADKDEIQQLLSTKDDFVAIMRRFVVDTLPVGWVVRPFSASKGWCGSISETISYE